MACRPILFANFVRTNPCNLCPGSMWPTSLLESSLISFHVLAGRKRGVVPFEFRLTDQLHHTYRKPWMPESDFQSSQCSLPFDFINPLQEYLNLGLSCWLLLQTGRRPTARKQQPTGLNWIWLAGRKAESPLESQNEISADRMIPFLRYVQDLLWSLLKNRKLSASITCPTDVSHWKRLGDMGLTTCPIWKTPFPQVHRSGLGPRRRFAV